MSGIVASRGSRAINEPWFRPWHDTGELQPLGEWTFVIYDPANTPAAIQLSLKVLQDMALDRMQTVSLWREALKAQTHTTEEHAGQSENVIRLLDEWMADESGYDEQTWPELKAALERNRLSSRHLFDD